MFANRIDAGRRLGAAVRAWRGEAVVVLGLPRGGVPVACEVAKALGAPLDVLVVRKLGVPFQPELAMGAIGEGGVRVTNEEVLHSTDVATEEFARVEAAERSELDRRARRYRGDRPRVHLDGMTAIIVDDGIATGSTARAACRVARAQGAARVVLAVPVAPPGWEARIGDDADEFVCLETPPSFFAIGQFYASFSQVGDGEVLRCLDEAGERAARAAGAPARDEEVEVLSRGVTLGGHLTVPEGAIGIAVFAHGSGSSRHSPRNRYVASVLHDAAIGTLLFDLLSHAEERDRRNVFDVELLTNRLMDATAWLRTEVGASTPIGYFGASTGAAAALSAAAVPSSRIAAVVARGGRPDLAEPRLPAVRAPTLLIVGGADRTVRELNERARGALTAESRLVVVPGATHLFEEPGALEAVAEAASEWFAAHFARAAP